MVIGQDTFSRNYSTQFQECEAQVKYYIMSKIVTTHDYQTSKTLSFYDLICFSLKMIVKIKFIIITCGDIKSVAPNLQGTINN